MTFNATLINVHTREEKLIQVQSPTDRYCDVQAAIRKQYTSFNWAIFETWIAIRPLPIAIAA